MVRTPPNIVYLHTHDTGRYVQPYGHAVSTPHLQRLAEEGVLFRQAFSAAPTCSPSRSALLTGQCAHSAGMTGLAHLGFRLRDYREHLVHTLRDAGYRSAMVGVQHVAAGPDEAAVIGYDEHLRVEGSRAPEVSAAAAEFIGRRHDKPFFLSVGFVETHTLPGGPSTFGYAPADDRYVAPPPTVPDTPRTRADMAGFAASAHAADEGVGVVLEALERAGLADDTLVICTTDHGLPLPDMKCSLTDHGIGVLLIMRGPGPFTGGRVSDALVSHVDIFPTICDLVGVDQPPWLQGHSLLPLLTGEREEIHQEIFAEVNYHVAYEPHRAVRTRRWKYIRRFFDRDRPVLANVDDSPSKDVWLEHGWPDRPRSEEQLYDLVFDPQERRNLAGEPALAPVRDECRERLERWMRATDDPLLAGPVPAPAGASVGSPDALSPSEPRPPVRQAT